MKPKYKKVHIHKGERFFDAFKVMVENGDLPDPSLNQWQLMIQWVDSLTETNHVAAVQTTEAYEMLERERKAYKTAKSVLEKRADLAVGDTLGIPIEKLNARNTENIGGVKKKRSKHFFDDEELVF